MKYYYYDLLPGQFEDLVVAICQKLLGMGVQAFSSGPDGGRDARFVGRAECFPSRSAPWEGTIIVQAKHTEGINRKLSDPDFSGDSPSSVLSNEIPRIRRLRERGELDYYLLLTNRKAPAEASIEVVARIANETLIPEEAVRVVGLEDIERYLKTFPEIAMIAAINPLDSPLRVSPDDLARIILAFSRQKDTFKKAIKEQEEIRRTSFAHKNQINGLSEEYAKHITRYIKDFGPIKSFFEAPENNEYLGTYQDVADEFNEQIIAHRQEHHTFDNVLNLIFRLLIDRDPDLARNKRLTRTMLFYMYWNCDIGKDENA